MRKVIALLFFTVIFPQEKTIELKDVMGGTFRYDKIGSYKWVNNQDAYYFSDSDSLGKNFYRYDLARDDTTAVFSIKKDQLDRFSHSFSKDQTLLLLKTNNVSIWRHSSYGTYHVYDIAKDTVVPVSANPDSLRNVKISPDNQYVSYVRNDNNLYLFSLEDLEEVQLTTDGSETTLNGHFGWVYEEEFGSYDAYRWSPSGNYIVFWQEDQSQVEKYPLIDYASKYPVVKYIYYPKAGQTNPTVKLGIIDLSLFSEIKNEEEIGDEVEEDAYAEDEVIVAMREQGAERKLLEQLGFKWGVDDYDSFRKLLDDEEEKHKYSYISWIQLPEDTYYIPNAIWHKNKDDLYITTLNRKQNDLKFFRYNLRVDYLVEVLNDKNETWVDAYDFFGSPGLFNIDILDNDEIIWISERDGFKHIYRSRPDGQFINQITRGKWEVNGINAIDEENEIIYFSGKRESEVENHIYSVRFNGSKLKRLTSEQGTHSARFSPTTNFFIDSYSNFTTPSKIILRSNSGTSKRMLAETDRAQFDEYGFTYPRLINLFTNDGERLNAIITLPHNFDSMEQYPVILYNYGGPGSQMVNNRWGAGNHVFHQYFSQRGFIIFSFDNRGTGGRGKAFKDMAYGDYGKYIVKDHIEAAKYLQSLPYVDGDNIGVWGWSGGGYLTNMCMTLASDYFKAGVSVAPNVDPLLYDTIWTERYMGLVEENPEGYKNASVLTHVEKAKGHLLQIHGTADDNVHHQHSIQLAKAYAEHGKEMELFLYPNGNHGMSNNNFLTAENKADGLKNRKHLYEKMINFLMRHLSNEK
ncbi:MAG TPA: S9 family peptidase [Candidatus Marinimicrobia bacterium]|jgi:dipeptidyl-peptidase-4|nr:S9 family peptidase [Candidatus Neomarinimicrobiota bacterium]